MRIHMSKQQEMIEQLQSTSHAKCLEAIDALYGVESRRDTVQSFTHHDV